MSTKSIAYTTFIDSLDSSDFTRANYTVNFTHFYEWSKAKTPDALLKGTVKVSEDRLRSYIGYLKGKGYAASTIHTMLAAVRKFYDQNRVTLNWKWLGTYLKGTNGHVVDRDYTKEELAKILDICNLRQKAIFLTLMNGIRLGALASHCTIKEKDDNGEVKDKTIVTGLHLRNLTKITSYKDEQGEEQELDQPLYKFVIYEGDDKNEYFCFSTFEAAKAIDAYKAFREQQGEVLTPDSWLFRLEFSKKNATNPKPLTREALSYMFTRMLRQAGVRTVGKQTDRKPVMLLHGLRKFANSRMVDKNLNFVAKERLLGHSVGLEASYLKTQEPNFLREWLKVIPLLTVSQEKQALATVKVLESKVADMDTLRIENLRLRDQVDEQRDQIAEIKAKQKEQDEFKARIEKEGLLPATPNPELGITTEGLRKKMDDKEAVSK